MKILLCNDDGIHAEGIWALHKHLAARHTVVVVAPDRERTASSHAITLHAPIRVNTISINGRGRAYAVSGTPADCIKLAVTELLGYKPDLVISGINPGANIGIDVNYSGTLAAAREATFYGIPALAVSIASKTPAFYGDVAGFIEKDIVNMVSEKGLPKGTLLNINAPDLPLEQMQGVRFCKQHTGLMAGGIEKRMDPRNRPYYWYGANQPIEDQNLELDAVVLHKDYISITPIKCDTTDHQFFQALKGWDIPLE
jgi:5'-nucleotidase